MGLLGVVVAGGAGGCAASGGREVVAGSGGALGPWTGPTSRAVVSRKPWSYTSANGQTAAGEVIESESFRLYSTIPDGVTRERLVQVLEASMVEYRRLAPTAGPATRPMDSWVFETRAQWMDFTRRTLGKEAPIYLQIIRGGYTIDDRFVSHYTADIPTWSTTAHEGFHQFASMYFKGRLPPFLEEGLSTTFEEVKWSSRDRTKSLPRLNPRVNPQRALDLRTAMEKRATWPLEELVRLHPGLLLSRPGVQISSFYAQSWAFARFLQEYDNGKYRAGFARWMADTVAGTVVDPTGTLTIRQQTYSPQAVKPVIEHYTGVDLKTLQAEFTEWCRYLAYTEYDLQWKGQ